MKAFLTILFLLFSLLCGAQEVIPELITDRPDQTESAEVVPLKSLQIESGFLIENEETGNVNNRSYTYNATLLRYGLLKNIELRLGIDYMENKTSGFSPLYTGFKIKVAEEDDWVPSVAFLGGLILPFTATDTYKPEHTAANMRFSFSNTLSDRVSLGYNLGVEWDGNTAVPGYFYSVSLGFGISDKLGTFIESYGLIPEKGEQQHMADAGITYLLLPNLQLDLSGGIRIHNGVDNFIGLGVSYRIPNNVKMNKK